MPISIKTKRIIVFGYNTFSIAFAWMLAYWFRYNLHAIPAYWLIKSTVLLPFVVVIQSFVFHYFGVYRSVWHFVSLTDLLRIAKATAVGTLGIAATSFIWGQFLQVPRSVPALYAMILMSCLCSGPILYRWLRFYRNARVDGKRILIVGAGAAAEQLVRDLLRHAADDHFPIAYVDDDKNLFGREIHGIRVVGSCRDIQSVVSKKQIDLILIALPSANSQQMRTIVERCEAANVPFRTLPGLRDITNGKVSVSALRPVSLEDLLGRDPVELDWAGISHGIQSKRILVTGGGGSIGAELCRQIAKLNPQSLIVIEQNEFNLYQLETDIKAKFSWLNFAYYLADVTDKKRINTIVAEVKPDIIFHAAAYKHVPLLESQILAAVKNNVIGTQNMCEAAIENDVDKFVLISTDKSVNPTNIMGSTKRIAELFCQRLNGNSQTKFIVVRFGNVLGSVGSVIPLFHRQIEQGGPVTVTHPDITRFFMTIPEAAQLILQAVTLGNGGEVFVLDMGEPIKISYLAEQMIRLAGFEPGKDIDIIFTGLRVGEKLYEELFYKDERYTRVENKKMFTVKLPKNDRMLGKYLVDMTEACEKMDAKKLKVVLTECVNYFGADASQDIEVV